jgi:RND family efflux transporter MFP subunit
MSRKLLTTISGTVIIGIIGAILVLDLATSGRSAETGEAADDQAEKSTAGRAVSVEVVSPRRETMTRELRMPATLLPYEAVDLYAKTSGYVLEIKVDIGDRVNRGDELLIIDVPEMADDLRRAEAILAAKLAQAVRAEAMIETARATVQRAEAEHDLSHLNHQRTQALREGNAVPQQQLDEAKSHLAVANALLRVAQAEITSAVADLKVAESEVAVAEAAVGRIETLMGYATIRAPFEGAITNRLVDPGAFVRSAAQGVTTPLLTIAMTNRLRLALEIPETDAPFVDVGTEVLVDVKAVGGEPIRASVARTARSLKTDTRTMRVELDLDNSDGRLTPGMYAQVVVNLETKQQAMVIPSKAIRVRGRALSVLVAEAGVARAKPVEIGYDDGIRAEITAGLDGNEQIIVSANNAVTPGAPVRVAEARSVEKPLLVAERRKPEKPGQ